MWKKTTEATGRAWKFDNKYVWAAIFLIGNALGYSVPATLEGVAFPFADKTEVQKIEQRVDDLENAVFNTASVEQPTTPTPIKQKINVEGY